jgi:hypothetical protein
MPLLPQPLEAVIVRAMNVDPTQRFPSVRAFGAALLQFASEGARVLWADAFRADEVARASNVEAGFTRPMLATGPGSPGSVSGTQILPSSSASASTARSPLRGTTLGAATGQRLDLEPPRRGRAPLVIAFVVAVAGGGGAVLALRPKTPPTTAPAREASATPAPAATYRLEVDTDPPGATVELDGIPAGVGMLSRDLPKDGREHRLVARAPGYRDAVVRFLDQPPARHIRMAADETAPPPATAATTATTTPPPSKVSPPPKKGHPHPHPSKGPAQPQQPAPRETPPPANGAPVID